MLRLPPYDYHRPATLSAALELLDRHGRRAMLIAGGTDLVPNLKHRLFEPEHLVSLRGIEELRGIDRVDAPSGPELVIGATESLAAIAASPIVREYVPSLSEAAAHVAGPQLRNAGTIGGNLCLDTRCTYYNQTYFWREALGFCLKKDGDVCHVTRVGKKCVAAHSADTPPVLMTVDAVVDLASPAGNRSLPVRDFFVTDGIWNSRRTPDEIVIRIRIPIRRARSTGYAKLRQRGAVDFPLLTVAVRVDWTPERTVDDIDGVVTALGSRPRVLSGWNDIAAGHALDPDRIEALAQRAHDQCRPLENQIVDADWRRAMVPTFVRRALAGATDTANGT